MLQIDLCSCTRDFHSYIRTAIGTFPIYLYTSDEQVDDFADAQRTPLPKCIAGVEGDKVLQPTSAITSP